MRLCKWASPACKKSEFENPTQGHVGGIDSASASLASRANVIGTKYCGSERATLVFFFLLLLGSRLQRVGENGAPGRAHCVAESVVRSTSPFHASDLFLFPRGRCNFFCKSIQPATRSTSWGIWAVYSSTISIRASLPFCAISPTMLNAPKSWSDACDT